MKPGVLTICATREPRPPLNMPVSPLAAVAGLLKAGYDRVEVCGDLFDQIAPDLQFFVDDDVRVLVELYGFLERLQDASEAYEFDTVLGDGLLVFTTISDRRMVELGFRFSPGLDVANLVSWRTTLDEQEYIWWWRSIIAPIMEICVGG